MLFVTDIQKRQRTIASVVRVFMAARNETHADLAGALGLSRPAVSQKLAGRINWTLADLERLADYYGTEPGAFLSGDVLERLGVIVGDQRRPRALAVPGAAVPQPRAG